MTPGAIALWMSGFKASTAVSSRVNRNIKQTSSLLTFHQRRREETQKSSEEAF